MNSMKQGLSWEDIKFTAVKNWLYANPEKLINQIWREKTKKMQQLDVYY